MHHVVTGALVREGRVLLAHRSAGRRWYPDVWDLPGGHVDHGESESAALCRELREELGVEVTSVDTHPIARISDPESELELGLWVVRGWRGEPVNACPEEQDQIRWVAANDLRHHRLAHAGYPELLAAVLTS